MRESVKELDFEKAELLGRSVLFSGCRVKPDSVPKGLRLYEIRHEDTDDMAPCQIAGSVAANFYGSVLTSCPIQLPADGCLDLLRGDFGYADCEMTIKEYLSECPPEDADIMELSTFQDGTQSLFFSGSAKDDRKNRCIGHLRGDFGDCGEGFHTSWRATANRSLNTEAFKADLARVVTWLEEDSSPLRSFHMMELFCARRECARLPAEHPAAYGFGVDTKAYQYKLRCVPHRGEYNFYLYCYQRKSRRAG